MRNQQEELEALSQSHTFDIMGVSPVSGMPVGWSGGIGKAEEAEGWQCM